MQCVSGEHECGATRAFADGKCEDCVMNELYALYFLLLYFHMLQIYCILSSTVKMLRFLTGNFLVSRYIYSTCCITCIVFTVRIQYSEIFYAWFDGVKFEYKYFSYPSADIPQSCFLYSYASLSALTAQRNFFTSQAASVTLAPLQLVW